MLNGFEHMLTKSKQDQYLVQRYIFIVVCLWERDLSYLAIHLDPCSPEERDSQQFGRQEDEGLAGWGSSAQRFSSEAKRDKSELISRLTSQKICIKGRWSFDRQIYLDRKASWALLAGVEESRTMRRRPRRTGGALGAFILFCSAKFTFFIFCSLLSDVGNMASPKMCVYPKIGPNRRILAKKSDFSVTQFLSCVTTILPVGPFTISLFVFE